MTTDILTVLFIAIAIATLCYIILNTYSWVEARRKGKEEERDKELSAKKGDIVSYMESFYDKVRPYLEELGGVHCMTFARVLMPDRYTGLLEDDIIEALKQGVEYKRKYEALSKAKELELRKFCIEQHPDKRSCLSDRMGYAEILYQYITTGKQPKNKEEQS